MGRQGVDPDKSQEDSRVKAIMIRIIVNIVRIIGKARRFKNLNMSAEARGKDLSLQEKVDMGK